MTSTDPNTFAARASIILAEAWELALMQDIETSSDSELVRDIDQIFASSEIGYKKAVIIQTVGKAADPSLDAQSLQKGAGNEGSWDAREFAKRVFVPWNSATGSPLGTAPDPYVSNQFRQLRFDNSIRKQRKSKADFDATLRILESVNATKSSVESEKILLEILTGLRRFLNGRTFEYPLPNRSSLADTLCCLAEFLTSASGGARLQAVTLALFSGLREFGISYADIRSGHVNAADASSGGAGDIEFTLLDAKVAVEVKDRPLTFAEIETSVEKSRIAGMTELIFVVNKPRGSLFHPATDETASNELAARQFSTGLNVYFEPFSDLSRSVLMLLGESGRRRFLELVGAALEAQRADAQHRWAWAKAVKEI